MEATARRSQYQERIATLLPGSEPRHVEGFMRLEFGTLDHLSPDRFADEARTAVACCSAAGPDESEALAASFGL